MADPGEGPRGARPPLFLDQTEAQRAQKNFLGDRPPFPKGLDDRTPTGSSTEEDTKQISSH